MPKRAIVRTAITGAALATLLVPAAAGAEETYRVGASEEEFEQALSDGDAIGFENVNETLIFPIPSCSAPEFIFSQCSHITPPSGPENEYYVTEVEVLLPEDEASTSAESDGSTDVALCPVERNENDETVLLFYQALFGGQVTEVDSRGSGYQSRTYALPAPRKVPPNAAAAICIGDNDLDRSRFAVTSTFDSSDSSQFSDIVESPPQPGTAFEADNSRLSTQPGVGMTVLSCSSNDDCHSTNEGPDPAPPNPDPEEDRGFDLMAELDRLPLVTRINFDLDAEFLAFVARVRNLKNPGGRSDQSLFHLALQFDMFGRPAELEPARAKTVPGAVAKSCPPGSYLLRFRCVVPSLAAGESVQYGVFYALEDAEDAGLGPRKGATLRSAVDWTDGDVDPDNQGIVERVLFSSVGDSGIDRVRLKRSRRGTTIEAKARSGQENRRAAARMNRGAATPKELHFALVRLRKGQQGLKGDQPVLPTRGERPRCSWLRDARGRFSKRKSTTRKCDNPKWIDAKRKGKKRKGKFVLKLKGKRKLPYGRYVLYSRVTSKSDGREISFTRKDKNRLQFKLSRKR